MPAVVLKSRSTIVSTDFLVNCTESTLRFKTMRWHSCWCFCFYSLLKLLRKQFREKSECRPNFLCCWGCTFWLLTIRICWSLRWPTDINFSMTLLSNRDIEAMILFLRSFCSTSSVGRSAQSFLFIWIAVRTPILNLCKQHQISSMKND